MALVDLFAQRGRTCFAQKGALLAAAAFKIRSQVSENVERLI
jgi:hypothetical protein